MFGCPGGGTVWLNLAAFLFFFSVLWLGPRPSQRTIEKPENPFVLPYFTPSGAIQGAYLNYI